jgi:hypothetical protein
MKKVMIFIGILLVALSLAACGGSEDLENTEEIVASAEPGAMIERETPLALQLALGTFRLEDTDMPVDANQAAALLPLWKAARSLSQSETAATQEVEAVIKQIEGTMTGEQLAAIEAMNLSMADFASIAEELGLETGFDGRFGEMTPEMQATREAMRESGQIPEGGFQGGGPGGGMGMGPGGGMGGGPGGELSPEAMQTAIAERGGARGANLGLNQALIDAIIEFLEGKLE